MSPRERQPAAGVVVPPTPADRPSVPPNAARNGDAFAASEWESLFFQLPPAQQHSLLALVLRQGNLRAQQLPHLNGNAADRSHALFKSLLQGSTLEPLIEFHAEPIEPIDVELDASQRAAVGMAIHSPDVGLIRGLPGTGKSRVVAEVIRQSVCRGQRVLMAAPCADALDVVIERLVDDPHILALRCVGLDERADQLGAAAAARTFGSYRRQVTEDCVRHAQMSVQRTEAAIARARADLTVLDRLAPLAERAHQLAATRRELDGRLLRLPDELERAADDPFARDLHERHARHATTLQPIDQKLAAAEAELRDLQKQSADLEAQLAENERIASKRGWFGRLLGIGNAKIEARTRELTEKLSELRPARERAEERCRTLTTERDAALQSWSSERKQLLDAGIARRRAEGDRELARLDGEFRALEQRLQEEMRPLSANRAALAGNDPTAVESARTAVCDSLLHEQHDADCARRWSAFLSGQAPQVLNRLRAGVNVAFVTLPALDTDEHLTEICRHGPFDLVIVDETHRLSETELLPILSRGTRWLLIGEPIQENDSIAWSKLWQRLNHGVWSRERDRLCCRLRLLSAAEREQLETESVADSPEIELRILPPSDGPPILAEVLFPAATSIEQALTYLYLELNEVPIPSSAGHWRESAACLVLQYSGFEPTTTAQLEPGLHVRLAERDGAWQTVAIEFETGSGWGRDRAMEWLRQHARGADTGRAIDLPTLHRMSAAVAGFVSPLWFDGAIRTAPGAAIPGPGGVEFIPVPSPKQGQHNSNGTPHRLLPVRNGAGFEIDLADSRQRDRLPHDLRQSLPRQGLVNLSEARAIIQLLEGRAAVFASERPASIAVLTLTGAQAELIRLLVRQSRELSRFPILLRIEAANDFRHREADVVIVSLTRSHERRAVSFGDGPDLMPLAMSRAKRRLILVGDPGTLARRAQWDGPLDHLGESAARREKAWATALLTRLQSSDGPAIHLLAGAP